MAYLRVLEKSLDNSERVAQGFEQEHQRLENQIQQRTNDLETAAGSNPQRGRNYQNPSAWLASAALSVEPRSQSCCSASAIWLKNASTCIMPVFL